MSLKKWWVLVQDNQRLIGQMFSLKNKLYGVSVCSGCTLMGTQHRLHTGFPLVLHFEVRYDLVLCVYGKAVGFVLFLTVGVGASPTPLPALGTLFLPLGCLVQLQHAGFCLALLCFVLSFWALVLYKPALFWRGHGGKIWEWRGEGRWGSWEE